MCTLLCKHNNIHCPLRNVLYILSTDCKAVVPVVPLDYDVEVNDHHYLEKAMKKACKNREQDPRVLMKALYANTFDCVEDILVRNEQHSESIVRAARTTIRLQLAEGDAKALTTTLTVSELLEKLCISTKWDDTFLLERIVGCLPKEAKTLAMSLLDRYDSYLDVYDEAVKVKDSLKNATASPELTKAHIPVEVTLAKDVSETTLKDCKEMLAQLLCKAFKIPRTSITATEARSGSTTIICIVDKAFMMNVVKYSGEASALWAYQELSVTRIQIPGLFEVNVSQLLTQYFMEALRSGLTGDMDFVGATKVCGSCELLVLLFASLWFTSATHSAQTYINSNNKTIKMLGTSTLPLSFTMKCICSVRC